MTLAILQKGTGPRRPLLICYFVGPPGAGIFAALGPGACILYDLDDQGGRFAKTPGSGGVDGLDAALAVATKGDVFAPSAAILLGWSAGCQAVREQLRVSGDRVDAAVALDGISGAVPPADAQLAPWVAFAKRASENPRALLVVTHTQQTYTENLPAASRFASTKTTAGLLCDAVGVAAPGVGSDASKGGFYVVSSPSAKIDGMAHIRQVREVGPAVFKSRVVPWLAARAGV